MLSVLTCACPSSPGALSIDLKTDLVPGFEIQSVEVTLNGRTIRTGIGFEDTPVDGTRVARFEDIPNGRVSFEARLVGPDGRLISIEERGPVQIDGESATTLVYTRRCAAIDCPPPEGPVLRACLNAVCVEPRCSPDNLDACAAALCTSTSDCTPSPVDCAQTECVDGACLDIPIDGACEPGTRCTLEGCVPLPGFEPDAGSCTPGLPCEVANECETGTTVCDDTGRSVCMASPSPAGTACRAAADACDAVEVCDGINPTCPADLVQAAGMTCRDTADACDVAEQCDGVSIECPTDSRAPEETICAPEACGEPAPCECVPISGVPTPYEFLNCEAFRCDVASACTRRGFLRGRLCSQPDPPSC